MISAAQLIVILVVAALLYCVFFVFPLSPTLRNLFALLLAIVLFALAINLIMGVFPF